MRLEVIPEFGGVMETETVISLLLELHEKQQNILVAVTHNLEMADRFRLKYKLSGSRLQTTGF